MGQKSLHVCLTWTDSPASAYSLLWAAYSQFSLLSIPTHPNLENCRMMTTLFGDVQVLIVLLTEPWRKLQQLHHSL